MKAKVISVGKKLEKKLINSDKCDGKGLFATSTTTIQPCSTFTIASRAWGLGLQEDLAIGLLGCPGATDG